MCVTPHTGVWIETSFNVTYFAPRQKSRPTRACGLKQVSWLMKRRDEVVTPHTGVWIETYLKSLGAFYDASRPTRACGLKRCVIKMLLTICFSLAYGVFER